MTRKMLLTLTKPIRLGILQPHTPSNEIPKKKTYQISTAFLTMIEPPIIISNMGGS